MIVVRVLGDGITITSLFSLYQSEYVLLVEEKAHPSLILVEIDPVDPTRTPIQHPVARLEFPNPGTTAEYSPSLRWVFVRNMQNQTRANFNYLLGWVWLYEEQVSQEP
jgi:hypothetical protein